MTGEAAKPNRQSAAVPAELEAPIRAVCLDWGGTLMVDDGPDGVPMCQWPEVTVVAGARSCLAALHGRVPLCVATNAAQSSRPMIEAALDRVGLLRFFSDVFCFTEIGSKKNRRKFWSAVAERLGIPFGRIVMIGDSLEHDVLAPRRFGLQAVWFNRDDIPRSALAEPVPTVTGLGGVPGIVLRALS